MTTASAPLPVRVMIVEGELVGTGVGGGEAASGEQAGDDGGAVGLDGPQGGGPGEGAGTAGMGHRVQSTLRRLRAPMDLL